LADGSRVLALDLNAEALQQAAMTDGWAAAVCRHQSFDVREEADWQRVVLETVECWGSLDLLCNVAGIIQPGLGQAAGAECVDRHLDINAKGTILGTIAAAQRMVSQGHGQIVNLASMAALAPVPGLSLYTASKFAVRGFSLAIAQELRPLGVYVTVVCPDAVQTPMLDLQRDYPEAALTFSGPRYLAVDEVVDLICGRVLRQKPLEVTLPWSRGILAKLTSFAPRLAGPVLPRLMARGRARQAQGTTSAAPQPDARS
jgi:3-oxoacyl-[acyl-carrier protein] reductase